MNCGINDTPRCAPGTERPAAGSPARGGGGFSCTCLKKPTKSRTGSYRSALVQSGERTGRRYGSVQRGENRVGEAKKTQSEVGPK